MNKNLIVSTLAILLLGVTSCSKHEDFPTMLEPNLSYAIGSVHKTADGMVYFIQDDSTTIVSSETLIVKDSILGQRIYLEGFMFRAENNPYPKFDYTMQIELIMNIVNKSIIYIDDHDDLKQYERESVYPRFISQTGQYLNVFLDINEQKESGKNLNLIYSNLENTSDRDTLYFHLGMNSRLTQSEQYIPVVSFDISDIIQKKENQPNKELTLAIKYYTQEHYIPETFYLKIK